MDKFKKSLKSSIKWLILALIIALITTIGLYLYSQKVMNQSHISDFVHGLQTGIATGLIILIVLSIYKTISVLKNDTKLKEAYIKSKDERNQFIASKIGVTSFIIELFLLFLGIIATGFFNSIITLTLLGILVIKTAIKLILKVYYEKAY